MTDAARFTISGTVASVAAKRYTPEGARVTHLTVDAGTGDIKIRLFDELADRVHEELAPGAGVEISGHVRAREWENHGRSGSVIELLASDLLVTHE